MLLRHGVAHSVDRVAKVHELLRAVVIELH
jgi:hypothetical protein